MLITKLQGEFVRQYPSILVNFPEEGLMNINGPNGAGKTTILTLIELALFGNISGIKASEIKYDQAKKSQKWWIELTFLKDGNEYCVHRHETTAKANLSVNGKVLITGGQSEVTDHIVNRILRMDQTSFTNAFYARQDDFDNLIKLSPEKRKKEISRLLKIDKIDDAIKKVRSDKNQLITIIDEQERHIKNPSEFDEANCALKESLATTNSNLTMQEQIVKEREISYKYLLEHKNILDNNYEKHQELLSNLKEKTQERKYLTEMSLPAVGKELKEIADSKVEFSKMEQDIKKYDVALLKLQGMHEIKLLFVQKTQLIDHIMTLKNRLTAKKDRMDSLKGCILDTNYTEQIQNVIKEVTNLENIILSVDKDLIYFRSELVYVTNQGKHFKEERNSLLNVGQDASCPVCKRAMGEHFHTLTDDYKQKLESLATQHNELVKEIETREEKKQDMFKKINSLKLTRENLENESRKFDKLQDEFRMLQQDFQNEKQDYLNVEKQLNNFKDIRFDEEEFKLLSIQVEKLQKKKDRFSILSSLMAKEPGLLQQEKEIHNKIKLISDDIHRVESSLEKLKFNLEEYRSHQHKINKEVELLRAAEKELSVVKEEKKNVEVRMEHLEKDRNENQIKIKDMEERKRKLAYLIKTEEVFKNYKIDRMSKVRPRLESIMQDLLSFITDGKYDLVQLDDHYNVFVYRNGIKKPFHLFSGGEQKLIALCMRLAISRILTSQGEHKNFDYLALDEVLGSMDEGRQETIIDALRKLTGVFKQIFMITHNSNIKDLFDYTLQVEQNLDLSSRVYWTSDIVESI
ncbi:SMC family ATPase [Priestia aryabhattai]|uniref:Nuclease SbcCD subunit C n=1 Tax=Priestia aryabhattai TaxID=412384 RepID=A0AAX6NCP0_PRIAR|nr:SMC family ATPase [Priestia aryabhattai]MDU9693671.1 SMC family ATPase [Priestia aryabhattai]